jgi:hypothetical protein
MDNTGTQLNQALCAAIREFITRDAGKAFRELYESYLRITPRYVPECLDCGGWPSLHRRGVEADLQAVFDRHALKFGFIDAAPYVFKDAADPQRLRGFDHDLGGELMTILSEHYRTPLAAEWVEVPAQGTDEAEKFLTLYAGLERKDYDAVLSGQLQLWDPFVPAGTDPEWSCATALIFTTITYTGKDGLDFAPVRGKTRRDFIAHVAKLAADHPPDRPFSVFSVTNPGPSYHGATDLVRDLAAAGVKALWTTGTVAESLPVLEQGTVHFTVADGIANAWQCAGIDGFKGLYLDIPAYDNPSLDAQTLLPLAAFTLKRGSAPASPALFPSR